MANKRVSYFIFLAIVCFALLGEFFCSAEPSRQYFGENEQLSDPGEEQRMLISDQFKRQILRNLGQNPQSNNWKRFLAQKRFATVRQTRGGVALCLWKVCPAGPWLVQKK